MSVGQRPLEALDGQVISDVLAGEGWSVSDVAVGTPAMDVAALAAERRVELVVMPTSRAADLLADAAAYTELRRLDDPPLIVACSLGERDDARRARAAGADAFLSDLDELLAFVAAWLPAAGARHWGVRLRQRSSTLVVTPTGSLDAASVARLRQVVESRAGRHDALRGGQPQPRRRHRAGARSPAHLARRAVVRRPRAAPRGRRPRQRDARRRPAARTARRGRDRLAWGPGR